MSNQMLPVVLFLVKYADRIDQVSDCFHGYLQHKTESEIQSLASMEVAKVLGANGIDAANLDERYEVCFYNLFLSRFACGDNFSCELFRIFYKSDCINLYRFLQGFPLHVAVFLAWRNCGNDEIFFKDYLKR